jgi:hypothetical protein
MISAPPARMSRQARTITAHRYFTRDDTFTKLLFKIN